MENTYKVYKHIFPNKKVYIGITKGNPHYRWKNKGKGYRCQPLIWRAIQKYGWENVKHIILYDKLTREEAMQKEKEQIKKFNAHNENYGYNLTDGGEGMLGYVCTEETRQKIAKASKGRHHTEETKRLISEKNKGHKVSEKALQILEENRKKMIANGVFKRPHNVSDEGRLVLRKNTSCAIVQYDINKNPIALWESATLVIQEKNINPYNALRNNKLKAGGFYWRKCKEITPSEAMNIIFKKIMVYTYKITKGVENECLFLESF